jgi:hypothetical protein
MIANSHRVVQAGKQKKEKKKKKRKTVQDRTNRSSTVGRSCTKWYY